MIGDFCQSGSGGGDERRLDSESILKEESTVFPDSLCGSGRERECQGHLLIFGLSSYID